MALIEMFWGNPESKKDALLNVLDNGLCAAEGRGSAIWSGSDDLRIQLCKDRALYPDFIDRVDPGFKAIYEEWLVKNRARVDAVLARKSNY
jgi:hypothetical protein